MMQLSSLSAQKGEEIQYFFLDLFPQNYILAFDRALEILSLLACIEHRPQMVAQQRFAGRESHILLALLSSYPDLVPYEVIHVSFYQGFDRLSEQSMLQAKQRLDVLRSEQGLWSAGIRALRNTMDHVRWHLREFGLDAACTTETGYALIRKEPGLHRAQLQLMNHD